MSHTLIVVASGPPPPDLSETKGAKVGVPQLEVGPSIKTKKAKSHMTRFRLLIQLRSRISDNLAFM